MYSCPHSRTTPRSWLSTKNPAVASQCLQSALDNTAEWAKKWKIKINANKSYLVPGMLRVNLYSENFETKDCVKYLDLYMDKRLTWKYHIKKKRIQPNHKMKTMNWIPGRKSKLTLYNKLLPYKVAIIPIWTYEM